MNLRDSSAVQFNNSKAVILTSLTWWEQVLSKLVELIFRQIAFALLCVLSRSVNPQI